MHVLMEITKKQIINHSSNKNLVLYIVGSSLSHFLLYCICESGLKVIKVSSIKILQVPELMINQQLIQNSFGELRGQYFVDISSISFQAKYPQYFNKIL